MIISATYGAHEGVQPVVGLYDTRTVPLETIAEVEPVTVVPPLELIPLNDAVPVMTTVVTNEPGTMSVTENEATPLNKCCTSVGVLVTMIPPVIRA